MEDLKAGRVLGAGTRGTPRGAVGPCQATLVFVFVFCDNPGGKKYDVGTAVSALRCARMSRAASTDLSCSLDQLTNCTAEFSLLIDQCMLIKGSERDTRGM